MGALALGSKKVLVLGVVAILFITGCGRILDGGLKEEGLKEEGTDADGGGRIEIARDINQILNTERYYGDMADKLEGYKGEVIDDEVYDRFFDVRNRKVAAIHLEDGIYKSGYRVIDVLERSRVDANGEKFNEVFIIYRFKWNTDDEGDSDYSMDNLDFYGVNKYIFRGLKVTGFEKLF